MVTNEPPPRSRLMRVSGITPLVRRRHTGGDARRVHQDVEMAKLRRTNLS